MIASDYEINLPLGVLVDSEDLPKISQYKTWFIATRGNVAANHYERLGVGHYKRTNISLHRLIMDFPIGMDIDHINGNQLDNRRANLRICEHRLNSRNNRLAKNNSSGFSGVRWDKERKKWTARIKIDYKDKHLGRYDTIEEAISARLFGENYYFGEYAPNA